MQGNTLLTVAVVAVFVIGGLWLFGRSGNPLSAEESGAKYRDPRALSRLIEERTEPFVLVDVRTPEEYAAGHIPGALNIPYDAIRNDPPAADKNALIILYCRSGNRSSIAKKSLENLGYTRIEDFGAVSRFPGGLKTGARP